MFNDFSFIISTNRRENHTVKSVPPEAGIIISTSKPLGKARNVGIYASHNDWIVIADDDISFDSIFLNFVDKIKSRYTIVGLEAYYPSPFCIGRFLLFHRDIFNCVGDFEERAHGDETEWLYRCVKLGYKIVHIPRESVIHHPHTKVKPRNEIPNLLWLLKKHPDFILYILRLVFTKMKKSSYDEEYEKVQKK